MSDRKRQRTWVWLVSGLAVLLAVTAGVAWGLGWLERPEDPRVIEIGEMMQGML